MGNITVKVPESLDRVIDRVTIRKRTKHKALRYLMDLALADHHEFDKPDHYGGPEKDKYSCTLDVKDDDYERATAYRERYNLLTRISFLRFVLVHGAVRFESGA